MKEQLETILERVFPYARRIAVTTPVNKDGEFIAELLLPVRNGESVAQLYRFPINASPDLDGTLSWTGADQRFGTGHGVWGWIVAWDGNASQEEVWALVAQRVLRHPQIGDSGNWDGT